MWITRIEVKSRPLSVYKPTTIIWEDNPCQYAWDRLHFLFTSGKWRVWCDNFSGAAGVWLCNISVISHNSSCSRPNTVKAEVVTWIVA